MPKKLTLKYCIILYTALIVSQHVSHSTDPLLACTLSFYICSVLHSVSVINCSEWVTLLGHMVKNSQYFSDTND